MLEESVVSELSTEYKILQAAESEFMNKGFDGARTTAIAESAGVTHAMFHYYFRTKKKLFERIVAEKVKSLKQLVATALGHSDKPLFERLAMVISDHLDFLSQNPNLPRFLIMEMYTDKERMNILLSNFGELAANVIEELQNEINIKSDEGLCRRADARMLILDILSLNMFSFVAAPVSNIIIGDISKEMKEFVEIRKKENIETIMRKLKL